MKAARAALSLFTVLPVSQIEVTRDLAARAVLWMPAVGALLGLIAGGALWLVQMAVAGPLGTLLAAVVAVAMLALLTGGLHVDGLADTVDGLASRRPGKQALEIMRRSDVGPLGAAAVFLALLLQVTALATVPRGLPSVGSLLLATVTARTAVVIAAGRRVPAARPEGFGALVAGTVSDRARVLVGLSVAVAVMAIALLAGAVQVACTGLIALAAGLLAGYGVQRLAQRQFGGVTGDVFGAIVEVSTVVTLVTVAVA